MKYFFVISLLVAVASARMVKPTNSELAELEEIIAAINSPSTDPATAAALEEMLLDALGIKPEPVQVGPAVIDATHPISIGPAIIDYPLPEGALVEEPIVPTPVIVAPAPAEEAPVAPAAPAAPLVQIILNINQAAADVSPVAVGPAVTPVRPTPVGTVRPTPEASLPVGPAIDRPVPEVSLPIHPVGGVKPTQPILAPRA
ncbi:uncharacterized protein LOC118265824 [Spodoptera frugiperda]|uniref:Uncharacterized protein LOC118265824 n=1 Tax=Spodoptera frugiperda TaxID=7108 RepID=A0A9R0EHJ8_SPOFR|nr:uncharacterized protein LOC118265824 [Spodoptera frugiperda]